LDGRRPAERTAGLEEQRAIAFAGPDVGGTASSLDAWRDIVFDERSGCGSGEWLREEARLRPFLAFEDADGSGDLFRERVGIGDLQRERLGLLTNDEEIGSGELRREDAAVEHGDGSGARRNQPQTEASTAASGLGGSCQLDVLRASGTPELIVSNFG